MKTILIAETHKEQANIIRRYLEPLKDQIQILDNGASNSQEMKDMISQYKPNIVITNERKKDGLATDIIKEIQDDPTRFQPIFIIVSAFSDMEYTCQRKGITAHYIQKPYSNEDITECITEIIKD